MARPRTILRYAVMTKNMIQFFETLVLDPDLKKLENECGLATVACRPT
jgi:hypothetical protein